MSLSSFGEYVLAEVFIFAFQSIVSIFGKNIILPSGLSHLQVHSESPFDIGFSVKNMFHEVTNNFYF
jgi:hypothetical protein